jgi:tRNA-2-methylthio-N6-dimethylallyladenosine synthase
MAPEATISTDIIVAFPGESDEDFKDTIDMMKEVKFDQIFSFKYSSRPETEAENFTNVVDEEVGSDRLSLLQSLNNEIIDEKNASRMGNTYRIYFESLNRGGYVAGRSDNNIVVRVEGSEELLGTFADVKVTAIGRTILTGEIVA